MYFVDCQNSHPAPNIRAHILSAMCMLLWKQSLHSTYDSNGECSSALVSFFTACWSSSPTTTPAIKSLTPSTKCSFSFSLYFTFGMSNCGPVTSLKCPPVCWSVDELLLLLFPLWSPSGTAVWRKILQAQVGQLQVWAVYSCESSQVRNDMRENPLTETMPDDAMAR